MRALGGVIAVAAIGLATAAVSCGGDESTSNGASSSSGGSSGDTSSSGGSSGGSSGAASSSGTPSGKCDATPGVENMTADAVWRASDGPRYVKHKIVVAGPNNPILTIEPGAIVRFCPGTELVIGTKDADGKLDATGTPSSPIMFESASDNPAAGDWVGITFEDGWKSELHHATIRHCGASNGRAEACVAIFAKATCVAYEDCHRHARMTGLKIQRSKNRGIEVHAGGTLIREGTFASDPVILIENCEGYPLASEIAALEESPFWVKYSGNKRDSTLVLSEGCPNGCSIPGPRSGAPYAFEKTFTAKGGLTLSAPDTVLEFGAGAALVIEGTPSATGYALIAGGRKLTGIVKTPGSWGGLVLKPNSDLTFGASTIEYGGQAGGGNIVLEGGVVSVLGGSTIAHSAGCGVKGASTMSFDPTSPESNNTFTSNAGGATCP